MSEPIVAVYGFGGTGRALLDHLIGHPPGGEIWLVNDGPITEERLVARYREQGVRFLDGRRDFHRLKGVATLILSPGVDARASRFAPLRAHGVEIVAEIEYAARQIRAGMIAITGSNGKSTTVSLTHHILQQAGRKSVLAGNIGTPLIALLPQISADAEVVLELSSFQLEEIRSFHPRIAALLNITPDHLDRYPGMAEYTDAKLALFRNQQADDVRVLNADDPLTAANLERTGAAIPLLFSRQQEVRQGGFLENGVAVLRLPGGEIRVSLEHNPLAGVHNLENILAAFLCCAAAGVEPAAMRSGLETFTGLPHRMQTVARIGPVEFINDSKATNVDATLKSVLSIDQPLVVILGGKDKGGDFGPLAAPLTERAEKVILIGKAARTIADQLPGLADRIVYAQTLADAVEKGYRILQRKRGAVLLAPACASFDMFRNYEHRGEAFAAAVLELQAREAHG